MMHAVRRKSHPPHWLWIMSHSEVTLPNSIKFHPISQKFDWISSNSMHSESVEFDEIEWKLIEFHQNLIEFHQIQRRSLFKKCNENVTRYIFVTRIWWNRVKIDWIWWNTLFTAEYNNSGYTCLQLLFAQTVQIHDSRTTFKQLHLRRNDGCTISCVPANCVDLVDNFV